MKNLFTILLLLVFVTAKAQYVPNAGAYQYKGLKQTNSLQPPSTAGNPVTAINAPDSNYAALYYNKTDTTWYQFNPISKKWSPFRTGGGVEVDSVFITSIDSIFISNTDSIFIVSGNDTIFIGENASGMDSAYRRNDTLLGLKNGEEFFITTLGIFINGLNQPGYVSWSGTGLTFDVTNAVYTINNITYNSPSGQITLDAADPDLPRYDVIAVDTLGNIVKITGTPAANPVIPQVDPNSQVYLTAIFVDAGATTPGGITQEIIYDENTENWSGTASGITLNLDNTTNPYHLTKSADVGTWSATRNLLFTKNSGTENKNDYTLLKLFIHLKANLANTGNIRIAFLNGNTVVSNTVTLGAATGFTKAISGTYQNITIPISNFIFSNPVFNRVRLQMTGPGSGFYVDYVQLQGGIAPPPVANIYQDSTYQRNDSIFGHKNNTEFFVAKLYRDTAYLTQGYGVQMINVNSPDDSLYKPNGFDINIAVDTAQLLQYFNNYYTNITNPPPDSSSYTYIVYAIDGTPNLSYPDGTKVLVAASGTTGSFVGHENDIATLVGGVYTFVDAVSGNQLLLSNDSDPSNPIAQSYRFDGTNWIRTAIFVVVGGQKIAAPLPIGTNDSNNFVLKTNDTGRVVITPVGDVLVNKWAGIEDVPHYIRFGENGQLDTLHFTKPVYESPAKQDSMMYVDEGVIKYGTASGGGGTQNFEDVLQQQGADPFTTDNTVDFDSHSLTFDELSYFSFNATNGGTVGTTEAGVRLRYEGEDYSGGFNAISHVDSGTISTMQSLNSSTLRQHTLQVTPNEIFLNSSGTGGTNVKITGLDSSEADTDNIAWFDEFGRLHRGHITAGGGGGITTLNTLTASTQTFATGTSGSDFNISSATSTHTFNLPTASGSNRGALSSTDWTTFNNKIGGSGSANNVAYFSGTSTITGSSDFNYTSSILNLVNNSISTSTTTNVFTIKNTTAATSGNPKNSGRIYFESQGFNTNATQNGTQPFGMSIGVEPTSASTGIAAARGSLTFRTNSPNTGVFTVDYAGGITTTGLSTFTGGIVSNQFIQGNVVIAGAQINAPANSAASTYRTTDGGTVFTPPFEIQNGTSPTWFTAFDKTNGLVLGIRNANSGTATWVSTAAFQLTNTSATQGAETSDLSIWTKPTGSAMLQRMTITGATGNVLINTTTDAASSKLTLESTTQGVLIPRMTKTQRDAISSPAQGLLVFVTDNGGYLSWYNSGWQKVSSVAD